MCTFIKKIVGVMVLPITEALTCQLQEHTIVCIIVLKIFILKGKRNIYYEMANSFAFAIS